MSDNNKSLSININPYFIFCIAFTVVGVWFPDYFMWVVYAFVAYMAVIIGALILMLVSLLAMWLRIRQANKLGD